MQRKSYQCYDISHAISYKTTPQYLKRKHGFILKSQARLDRLWNFVNQASERHFFNHQLCWLLIFLYITQRNSTGPISVGLLNATITCLLFPHRFFLCRFRLSHLCTDHPGTKREKDQMYEFGKAIINRSDQKLSQRQHW